MISFIVVLVVEELAEVECQLHGEDMKRYPDDASEDGAKYDDYEG